MKIIHDFMLDPNQKSSSPSSYSIMQPVAMTIGNFDGVHIGHQKVINETKKKAEEIGGKSVVFTFTNHPSEVLTPNRFIPRLTSQEHKIHLIESMNIDYLILAPFTKLLASKSALEFINEIICKYNLVHLVLGYDALFGKDRQGTPNVIKEIGIKHLFTPHYLPPEVHHSQIISSSLIREKIREGDFPNVENLLGRQYSIYNNLLNGTGEGLKVGIPTLNIDIHNLCTPPHGIWAVTVQIGKRLLRGIASLGINSWTGTEKLPQLKIHCFEHPGQISSEHIEVNFSSLLHHQHTILSWERIKESFYKDLNDAKSYFFKNSH